MDWWQTNVFLASWGETVKHAKLRLLLHHAACTERMAYSYSSTPGQRTPTIPPWLLAHSLTDPCDITTVSIISRLFHSTSLFLFYINADANAVGDLRAALITDLHRPKSQSVHFIYHLAIVYCSCSCLYRVYSSSYHIEQYSEQ